MNHNNNNNNTNNQNNIQNLKKFDSQTNDENDNSMSEIINSLDNLMISAEKESSTTTNNLYDHNLDSNTAYKMAERGAIILCLGIPEGTQLEFGIDCTVFPPTGPKFKGMKMIPPGIHMIHYSFIDQDVAPEFSNTPRKSFFVLLEERQVLVLDWNSNRNQFELLKDTETGAAERHTAAARNFEFDSYLAPYPYRIRSQWQRLTSWMTQETLDRIISGYPQPTPPLIASWQDLIENTNIDNLELNRDRNNNNNIDNNNTDNNIGNNDNNNNTEEKDMNSICKLNFTPFEFHVKRKGLTPKQITMLNFDRSHTLNQVVKHYYNNNMFTILGELQLTFITFVIGHHTRGLDQWRRMLKILCASDAAAQEHPKFFVHFVSVLIPQLIEFPEDMFMDLTSESFLRSSLKDLTEIITSKEMDDKLERSGHKFAKFVRKQFGWDFTSFDNFTDEDAPVVVEL